jgi:hypothetical protein
VKFVIEGVKLRVSQGGHNVPEQDIIRRFERSRINFQMISNLSGYLLEFIAFILVNIIAFFQKDFLSQLITVSKNQQKILKGDDM